MNRPFSTLVPALILALAILAATWLAGAAPQAPWAAYTAPWLLVAALVGVDAALRRRSGLGGLPSAPVLVGAAAIVVASTLVAVSDLEKVGAMMPIFGAAIALPLILQSGRACQRCLKA